MLEKNGCLKSVNEGFISPPRMWSRQIFGDLNLLIKYHAHGFIASLIISSNLNNI